MLFYRFDSVPLRPFEGSLRFCFLILINGGSVKGPRMVTNSFSQKMKTLIDKLKTDTYNKKYSMVSLHSYPTVCLENRHGPLCEVVFFLFSLSHNRQYRVLPTRPASDPSKL